MRIIKNINNFLKINEFKFILPGGIEENKKYINNFSYNILINENNKKEFINIESISLDNINSLRQTQTVVSFPNSQEIKSSVFTNIQPTVKLNSLFVNNTFQSDNTINKTSNLQTFDFKVQTLYNNNLFSMPIQCERIKNIDEKTISLILDKLNELYDINKIEEEFKIKKSIENVSNEYLTKNEIYKDNDNWYKNIIIEYFWEIIDDLINI